MERINIEKTKRQKGYSLVELAIVTAITGILIGGALIGVGALDNVRVLQTVAQVEIYDESVEVFTKFFGPLGPLPGSMPDARVRLPDCDVPFCNPATTVAEQTDGIIGAPNGFANAQVGALGALPRDVGDETVLFWTHLLKMDLITGVTPDPLVSVPNAFPPPLILPAIPAEWGGSHPKAAVGGGFHVKHADGTTQQPGAPAGVLPIGPVPAVAGTVFVLQPVVDQNINATADVQVLTPLRAAQIDRKFDDGFSRSGFVRAYGVQASCFQGGATATNYNETLKTKDCGLIFSR